MSKSLRIVGLLAFVGATAGSQERGSLIGRVTNSETGSPLQAATIAITGTTLGASTRSDGPYRISLPR